MATPIERRGGEEVRVGTVLCTKISFMWLQLYGDWCTNVAVLYSIGAVAWVWDTTAEDGGWVWGIIAEDGGWVWGIIAEDGGWVWDTTAEDGGWVWDTTAKDGGLVWDTTAVSRATL